MEFKKYEANIDLARTLSMTLPTKIIFGMEAVDQAAGVLKEICAKKTIVFADRQFAKLEIFRKVVETIEKAVDNYEIYDAIEKEPALDSVEEAVQRTRQGKFDSVVGIGGGSVMDTAKMSAAMATNKGEVKDNINPLVDKLTEESLPKILVPTTSGTGSEVDNTAVVIDPSLPWKAFSVSSIHLPTAAIVDPTLVVSCPPKVTAGCGMDAISHVVETFVSTETNPLSEGVALEAVRLIFRSLRTAYHNGKNLAARWDVSFAAMLGGLVLNFAPSAYPGHALAEVFGPQYQVPHGTSCAIALPYIMEFNLPACTGNLAKVSRAIGFDASSYSERELAMKAVESIRQLMTDMDMPLSLSEIGVSKDDLPRYRDLFINNKFYDLKRYHPRTLTPQNVDALLENMWKGTK